MYNVKYVHNLGKYDVSLRYLLFSFNIFACQWNTVCKIWSRSASKILPIPVYREPSHIPSVFSLSWRNSQMKAKVKWEISLLSYSLWVYHHTLARKHKNPCYIQVDSRHFIVAVCVLNDSLDFLYMFSQWCLIHLISIEAIIVRDTYGKTAFPSIFWPSWAMGWGQGGIWTGSLDSQMKAEVKSKQ